MASGLYKFIETPFRNKSTVVGWKLVLFLFISISTLLFIGYSLHKHNGFLEYKISKVAPDQRTFIIDLEKEKASKFSLKSKFRASSRKPFTKNPATEKILILGDSVSYDLYLAVKVNEHLFPEKEFRHQRLDDACFKYLGDAILPKDTSRECLVSIPRLSKSQQYMHADRIFFSAVWQQQSVLDVLKAIDFFGGGGRELTFIGSANFNDVASLSYQITKMNIPSKSLGTFFARNQKSDWKKQNERLSKLLAGYKARYLDKYAVFCIEGASPPACPLYAESKPLIYDTGHVTALGAAYFGRRVHELGWFDQQQ